jgi:predicted nucleic-acid-binding Zn-ribbon protein
MSDADDASPYRTRATARTCRNCGSEDVIPGVHIQDATGNAMPRALRVSIAAKPQAFWNDQRVEGNLVAIICGKCGYTELWMANAAELLAAYRKATTEAK